MILKRAALTACAVLCLAASGTASAQPAEPMAEPFALHAFGGDLRAGIAAFSVLAEIRKDDGEVHFSLAALQVFAALQGLQQDLYRFGAGHSFERQLSGGLVPMLRAPVPPNPTPEPATYAEVRAMIARFVDRLAEAERTLAAMPSAPFKLPVDIKRIAWDIDGDGKIGRGETLVEAAAMVPVMSAVQLLSLRRQTEPVEIAFDNADALWLQAYCNMLMGTGNFILAFDFETTYEVAFETIFSPPATRFGAQLEAMRLEDSEYPALVREVEALESRAQQLKSNHAAEEQALEKMHNTILYHPTMSDMERRSLQDTLGKRLEGAAAMLNEHRNVTSQIWNKRLELEAAKSKAVLSPNDGLLSFVSFIHSIDWQVIEPERLAESRRNLLASVQLNQATWQAIRAETDDDREWIPGPRQTSQFPSAVVTSKKRSPDEAIDTWLKSAETIEAILEGRLLLHSLRFKRGVNLKRFFEEAKTFDLVLFFTGPGALDWVEAGPVADRKDIRPLGQAFGGRLSLLSMWFN